MQVLLPFPYGLGARRALALTIYRYRFCGAKPLALQYIAAQDLLRKSFSLGPTGP